MTGRNVQDAVKAKGLPWTAAKGFDTFNPVSGFIGKDLVKDPHNLQLTLAVRLWLLPAWWERDVDEGVGG